MATKLIRASSARNVFSRPVVATIGNFDGVHLGHRLLLQRMNEFKQKAGGGTSILISFYPHPATVLKGVELPCITSLRQKLDCLSAEEVDVLYLIRFTRKFSELSAEDFIKSVLVEQLNVDHMVLGPDAAIGRGRGGDTDFIESSLKQLGRSCEKLEFLDLGQERISSRRIRSTISSGDVTTVAQMLGRPFALDARVIAGDGRGRGIGFPTANLKSHGQIVPPGGVYATRARVNGKRYDAVTNIGTRPTFDGKHTVVEAHLLDYEGPQFYGSRVNLEFLARIRDEKKFASVDELVRQIADDIVQARKLITG